MIDYKYLIFDVYGTLADWETGLYDALKPLLSRFPSALHWSRVDALRAFASVEKDIQAQNPSMLYSDILAKAHEAIEARLIASEGEYKMAAKEDGDHQESLPIADPSGSKSSPAIDAHTTFGNSIKQWPIFPDSAQALRDLSAQYKLIVLSNVDHASFAYTHSYLSEGTSPTSSDQHPPATYTRPLPNPHPRDLWLPQQTPNSKSPFSLIMTAQDTHVYKPAIEGFLAVLDAIRNEPSLLASSADIPTLEEVKSQTLIVAQSIMHDHEPARRLGLRSVWIDRQGAAFRTEDDGVSAGWGWRFETLGDMARVVEEEF